MTETRGEHRAETAKLNDDSDIIEAANDEAAPRQQGREGLEGYAKMVVEDFALVRERGGDWPNQVEMLAQFASLARRIEDDPITTLPGEAVMLGRVFGTLAGLFLHYRPDTSAATSVLPILLFALSRTPIEA